MLVETLRPGATNSRAGSTRLWRAGKLQSEIPIPLTEFKVHAAEVANKLAATALTVTGGYGYHRGPIERSYRDARGHRNGAIQRDRAGLDRQGAGRPTAGAVLRRRRVAVRWAGEVAAPCTAWADCSLNASPNFSCVIVAVIISDKRSKLL
ncbi:hypothetical protein I3J27_32260 [Bradyrhizobium xenonodulans]|uniref:Acyl-CoA dehydrogenase/oxidase C-terminal domain-containing protein n=1 Tax=Bradyrhizobium xenonodulans TaxID=2736875 RepID=A0ABY7MGU6_9BRAD|nr:acyl-CoA dehydrogenase family protein [Bradyrhizobium xenonodulans]WBL77645.1 hypothetical protein I3J27_32260 [Bradyrhizobium xenonodulans]